jgi:DNA-binding winged helix-turn-helix (wHTH) protein/tetratricopeptide (TPR) repeat protein
MTPTAYRFGRFRLVPSRRELWDGDALVALPRRVYDCLSHLVEHCDRAVGRDELAAVLWGHAGVSDKQVNQLIVRTRRALDDDGNAQATIRTVTGFGYRWAMPVERDGTPERVGAAPDANGPVPAVAVALRPASRPLLSERWTAGVLLVILAAAGIVATAPWPRTGAPARPLVPALPADAVIVLPVDVQGPADAGWMRLGIMDLVAERLRGTGLPVPPSESVLIALGAQAQAGVAAHDGAALPWTDSLVIRGTLAKVRAGWRVELATSAADGSRHQVQSERGDAAEAARTAADLLLAALGRSLPAAIDERDRLEDRLQQVQAAMLAGQLDHARQLLVDIRSDAPDDPRLRLRLAEIDLREGRLDRAESALEQLIAEPATTSVPALRARTLTLRGAIGLRRENCDSAWRDYDAAAGLLALQPRASEWGQALVGRSLASTCRHAFVEAASDLGEARLRFESVGDRLGVAKADTYRGMLELERGRPIDAIAHLQAAADVHEAFGAVGEEVSDLLALFDAQTLQLEWDAAWRTSERAWALRGRIGDPEQRLLIGADRVRVLAAKGRFSDAGELAAGLMADVGGLRPAVARYLHAAMADLAWRRGDASQTLTAASLALATWPESANEDLRARMALLHQRAVLALGDPSPPPRMAGERVAPAQRLADAERFAAQGRASQAEEAFTQALAQAEAEAVPSGVALVAVAYARWLLAEQRSEAASALAGRLAGWATQDFDCALTKLQVLQALGRFDAWTQALTALRPLAGERLIPEPLQAAAAP